MMFNLIKINVIFYLMIFLSGQKVCSFQLNFSQVYLFSFSLHFEEKNKKDDQFNSVKKKMGRIVQLFLDI